MTVKLEQRLFTVAEVERMAASGILDEDDRLELIEGVLVKMSPMGPRHASSIARLTALLGQLGWPDTILWIQNPIQLSAFSAPEPDLAIVRARDDFYHPRLPGPEDVLLVIEVADSSLATDRSVKLKLYAEALIPELWILDLSGGMIEQYSNPDIQSYRTVRRYGRGATLTISGLPTRQLATTAILG
ncbi:MAG TPA: Uma2 family endonuclease [Thermomicrobiales bacterium]|jgi:Uma2 family endonuclease